MKNLIKSMVVILLVFTSTVMGQTKTERNQQKNLPAHFLNEALDIITIKADIDTGNRGYFMTGSFTILKTPVRGDVATSFDASFRNNRVLSREGSNYIQANAQARRNDNNRNNEFRVYVHRDRGPQGHVDRNNIKVNWKGSSVGELDGKLSNVTVLYKKESILIIGTMQKNGYTLGVSLAIVKEAKLI